MGKRTKALQPSAIVGTDEPIDVDGLTIKQRLFIDHYIVCMNGTEAARLAGYSGDDRSLAVMASQNLRNVNIARALERRLNSFSMSASEVLIRLTDIARGDIGDALNSAGGIDATEAKAKGRSHLIKRYKTKTTVGEDQEVFESEVEMYDALDALKTLAKFHALLVDRVKVDDWRSQAIEDIKAGRLNYGQLASAFSDSVAAELFAAAGVQISLGTTEA
jgi:phage terminase small subunit